jgi:hypothetical protein
MKDETKRALVIALKVLGVIAVVLVAAVGIFLGTCMYLLRSR